MLPVGRDSNYHRHTERGVRRSTNDETVSDEDMRLRGFQVRSLLLVARAPCSVPVLGVSVIV